jgi:hypothetical protein
VTNDFYVDDGLTSCPTAEEAIKVMKDTQEALKKYEISAFISLRQTVLK